MGLQDARRVFPILACLAIAGSTVGAADAVPSRVHTSSIAVRFWVERSVADAAGRLEEVECQQVLADFQDASGRSLRENLMRTSMSAPEFVRRGLWFVDATGTPPCTRGPVAAFTAPGSRVIFVCSMHLLSPRSRLTSSGLALIHEALHALGLPENPPSPAAISRQVARRCSTGSDR
jgi:hypothetical protein